MSDEETDSFSFYTHSDIHSLQSHATVVATVNMGLNSGSVAVGSYRHSMMEELARQPTIDEINTIIDHDWRELERNPNYADSERTSILRGGPAAHTLFHAPSLARMTSHVPSLGSRMSSRYGSLLVPVAEIDVWQEQNHEYDQSVGREVQILGRTILPLIVSFLLQNSLSMASVFFVGRLGSDELSAVTLGSMSAIITGFAAIQGLSTCLDTLCAQSFGAGRYTLVGLYFQRCTALIFTCFGPILLFWLWGARHVLTVLIPEPRLVELSVLYLRYIGLGVPGFVVFETGKRYLQAQGIFNASTYILCAVAPLNIVLNYTLILSPSYGLGFVGAPIAVSITYYLMAGGLFAFVYLNRANPELQPLRCWGGWDFANAFHGWGVLFALGLPGVVMVVLEFLAFEAMTFMAAYLGPVPLAAQSIMASLCLISFQVPFAVGIATSTRVANLVGAGLPNSAKHTVRVSVLLGCCIAVVNFGILFGARFVIPKAFSTDAQVVAMVANTIPVIAYMTFFDQITAVTSGILRGQGRQAFGSKMNLVGYYLVGLPVSWYLAFHTNLGISGLWWGVGGALAMIGLVQWVYVSRVNWTDILADAQRGER